MDKELEVRIRALVSGAKDVERLSREVQDLGQQRVPDTTGRFRSGLQSTSRYLRATRVDVLNLQGAIAALGVAAALREITRASDTFAGVRGRLDLVTDSTKQLAATERELFSIAQDTRSSYESTATLYTRVARNAEQLQLSQQRLFQLTTATNQAIQIGGSSTQEAANGVIQFSQALASGELRGDELRSVMENMPRLTQAIADGLNTDIGGLRDMAEQGELTADRVTQAVLSQVETIQTEYNALPRRVGQSLTQLQNDIQRALARSNVDPLIEGIDDLRDTLTDPQTIAAVTTLANAIITSFGAAAKAVSTTTQAVQFLADSLAADVHGAAAGDIPRLEDQITRLEELKGMGDSALGALNRFGTFGNNGGLGWQTWISDDEIDQQLAKLRARLKLSRELADTAGKIGNGGASGAGTPPKVDPLDPADFTGGGSGTGRGRSEADKQADAIQAVLDKLREQRDTYGATAEQAAIYRLKTLGASEAQVQQARDIAAGIEQLQSEEEIQERIERIEEERAKAKRANVAADGDLYAALTQEIELMGLSERARAQEVASRRLSADATDEQRAQVRQLAGELYDLKEAAAESKDGLGEFSVQAARNIQSALGDSVESALEQNFSNIDDLWQDLLRRMVAQAVATKLAGAIFGDYDKTGEFGGLVGAAGAGLSSLGGLFGIGGGGAGESQTAAVAKIFHSGGLVGGRAPGRMVPGSLFGSAARYHSGGIAGLKPNEVPVIAMGGPPGTREEILTASDPRHRDNLRTGDDQRSTEPATMQVQLAGDALDMTMRDWLEREIGREMGRR